MFRARVLVRSTHTSGVWFSAQRCLPVLGNRSRTWTYEESGLENICLFNSAPSSCWRQSKLLGSHHIEGMCVCAQCLLPGWLSIPMPITSLGERLATPGGSSMADYQICA